MAVHKPILELLMIFTISFVCTLIPIVHFLVELLWKGPTRIFGGSKRAVRPQVLQKAEFGTHQFIRLPQCRLKLHCVVNGPQGKPLMLFLHGFPEFWYSWRHQMKEFSKDYRVVACDMRGYGDSDKPSGIAEYTLDKLISDVDQLITELGYEKCTLVAHDWGGIVAWSYAAVHPERLERLIICNVPHTEAYILHTRSEPRKSLSQFRKSWYVMFFQMPVLPQLMLCMDNKVHYEEVLCGKKLGARQGTFTPEDIEAYKYTFDTYADWSGPINYYRAILRYSNPDAEKATKARKIIVPTLIIWGTNDGCLEKCLAEISRQQVERCEVKYVEGASHWVQQEEPELVNQHMREFLGKRY